MRTITGLLLACLLALCQTKAIYKVPAFENGKEYVYEYTGRVATGVDEEDKSHYSAFGMKAHLKIYTKDDKVYFKFDDIKVARVNADVDDFFEPIHMDYEEPTEGPLKEVVEYLEKPYTAVYEDGVFKHFYSPEDNYVNLRKAIVGLFQTNFHPEDEHDSHMYKVYEDGIGGNCKTVYKIGHFPDDSETDPETVLNVTKTRFYNDCKERPYLFFSSMSGYKCDHCKDSDKYKPLTSLGRVEYEIKGDKQQFTFEKIYSTGAVSFMPFTTHGQTVLSVVNQTLYLEDINDATTYEVEYKDLKKYETLQFHFHLDENEEDKELVHAHYFDRIYHKENKDNVVEELLPILAQLAKDYKEQGKESETIQKLIYRMQRFSYENFVELFTKHITYAEDATKEEKTIKYVLYEILPFVGTNPSFKYLLELIEEGKVDEATANEMIYKSPFYVKQPTSFLIDYYYRVINKDSMKHYFKTWNSAMLAYGTLLSKACSENQDFYGPLEVRKHLDVSGEYCNEKLQHLEEEFEKVKDDKTEANVYIRTIRNTGMDKAFYFLAKVAKNEKYPSLMRQSAIWGLESYDDKEEVAGVVAQIYFNPNEDYVLRINAFEVLLYARPTPEFFGSLILSLHKEENQKVASYIYSTLQTFANSTDPCHEIFNEHATNVLNYVKPPTNYDILRHSTNRIFSAYNGKYRYGRSSQFTMVPSEHSVIPRELYVRQSFNIFGYNFDFLEFGIQSDEDSDWTKLEEHLLPAGLRSHEKKHEDHVNEVVEKLHLDKHREHKDDATYEVYTKMFNRDIKYTKSYDYTPSSEIQFDGDKAVLDMHSVAYQEVELVIPNEMGFPVVIMMKIPLSWHLTGSVKFQPRYGEGVMGVQGVHMDSNLHFGVDSTVKTKMFVLTPGFTKYGYALSTKVGWQYPIKGSVDYDCVTKKLAVKYTPSTEKYEVFHYDTTPLTMYPEEPYYHKIEYSEHPVHREYNVGQDYFGVGLKFNFTYDYDWNDYASYRSFFKSFFKKDTAYEDYWYLADKWYAGSRSFVDYALLNPTAKPFHLHVDFEPSETHPTTEFYAVSKYENSNHYETEYGWESCKLQFELSGKGPVERTWKAELHGNTRYPVANFRKFVFHFERSPIPKYDKNKYEICYTSNVTYNNYMSVFSEKPEEVSLLYKGKLTMGKECDDSAKKIYFQIHGEKSEEQKEYDHSKIDYYKECKKDFENHNQFTLACWKVMKDAGRLDKYTVDIDHKNIPVEFKGFVYRLYSYFRHTFYNNLDIDYFHGSNDDKHLKIVANFSYEYPVLDVKVYRPDQTVYYNKVYVPAYFPKYEPFTITEEYKHRYLRKFFSYNYPMCFVSGNHFHTLDEVTYELPHGLDSCWHLAFGDCEHHHFFVFYKKAEYKPYGKAMKVMFGNDVLIATPIEDGKFEVTLNGEAKSLDGPVSFDFEVKDYEHDVHVSLWGKKGIYIESKAYGVELYFDGVNGSIFTTNLYKGKQCGYCGNFDGEKKDEFEGPDGKHWDYIDETHNFAVVKDDCKVFDM